MSIASQKWPTRMFSCAATSWNVGDLIAIGTLTGTALDSQTVAKVAQAQFPCAIARCIQCGNSITEVRGQIISGTKGMVAHNF